MNYLAHIFLAQPNTESVCGNLMGDFMKGVDIKELSLPIVQGIYNHRLVDRFTDAFPEVKALKSILSPERKRFSGVIADIVFDHLLIKHWDQYSNERFEIFIEQAYQRILTGRHYMNPKMDWALMLMIEQDWLKSYQTLDGVEAIIERISKRIRFTNTLSGAMGEVEARMDEYDHAFLQLFPELIMHVKVEDIESTNTIHRTGKP